MPRSPAESTLIALALAAWACVPWSGCRQGAADATADAPAPLAASFDAQGHRGARGLRPENTIAAARVALDYGMRTIELDLAVSRDSVLVVSHESHFNPTICELAGTEYTEATSLFSLTAAQIATVDCGSRPHPDFPYQAPAPGPKPTFRAFVSAADAHARTLGQAPPRYNVEIKSAPELDGDYTPPPPAFARLVLESLTDLQLLGRVTVQSFDPRPLAYLSTHAPEVELAGLVPVAQGVEAFVTTFNGDVDVYSPHHLLLTATSIRRYREAGIRVVPWTVNDKSRMRTLIRWGVDGIITDYPDRLAEVMREGRDR